MAAGISAMIETPSPIASLHPIPAFLSNWINYLVQDHTGNFFEVYKRDKIIKTDKSWTLITADGKSYISVKLNTGRAVGQHLWTKKEAMFETCGLGSSNYLLITLSTCSFLN